MLRAKITPFHSSLGDRTRLFLKRKEKETFKVLLNTQSNFLNCKFENTEAQPEPTLGRFQWGSDLLGTLQITKNIVLPYIFFLRAIFNREILCYTLSSKEYTF